MSQLTDIHMHGILAKVTGQDVWSMAVKNPAEALTAIDVNTNGKLFAHLRDHGEDKYRILVDSDQVETMDHLIRDPNITPKEIHFVPVLQGADSDGTLFTIIGAVLIVAAVLLTYGIGTGAAAGTGSQIGAGASAYGTAQSAAITSGITASVTGTAAAGAGAALAKAALFNIGLSLFLGGVSQLLAGNNSDTREEPGHTPSYIFGGPVNTTKQGNAVPIGFGVIECGSQIISASIRSVDIL